MSKAHAVVHWRQLSHGTFLQKYPNISKHKRYQALIRLDLCSKSRNGHLKKSFVQLFSQDAKKYIEDDGSIYMMASI